jgi:hypothetical protein
MLMVFFMELLGGLKSKLHAGVADRLRAGIA